MLHSEYAAAILAVAEWLFPNPGATDRADVTGNTNSMMTVVVDAGKKRSPRKSRTKLPSPNSDVKGEMPRLFFAKAIICACARGFSLFVQTIEVLAFVAWFVCSSVRCLILQRAAWRRLGVGAMGHSPPSPPGAAAICLRSRVSRKTHLACWPPTLTHSLIVGCATAYPTPSPIVHRTHPAPAVLVCPCSSCWRC